jgi:hypothetical protein
MVDNIHIYTQSTNHSGGYESFLNKIVWIKPKYDSRSISGRVISVSSDGLIALEDRKGRLTMIKKSDVSVISEVG